MKFQTTWKLKIEPGSYVGVYYRAIRVQGMMMENQLEQNSKENGIT